MSNLQSVIELAVEAHAGQVRKGSGLPYIVHPMAVLAKLGEWDITCFKCRSVALCHDIEEDCPQIHRDRIVQVIGEDAAIVVDELTFKPLLNGIEASIQKREYMRSFKDKSVHALVVKVADRVCNTLDFIATDPQYASKYWKKATNLFEIMLCRGDEINANFGMSVFPRMRYAQTTINRIL